MVPVAPLRCTGPSSIGTPDSARSAITDGAAPSGEAGTASHAIALKASLPGTHTGLTEAEQALLVQWLDRIAQV